MFIDKEECPISLETITSELSKYIFLLIKKKKIYFYFIKMLKEEEFMI